MKFIDANVRNQANEIENPLYLDWIDEDSTIITWILSTISEYMISYFTRSPSSYQLWRSINEKFARSLFTHSIKLRTKLLSIKQGKNYVPLIINEIKNLSDQLAVNV